MASLLLVGAIIFEVAGTISLRMAVVSDKRWYLAVAAGYVLAFWCLTLGLAQGLAIGAAYGIWAASGVALTAILGKILFNEPLTWMMGLGIIAIVTGVLLVEVGA
ncbi:MAG: SMR family transporter [Marmoricola sp.]